VALGYEALRGSTDPANNTGNWNTALGYQTLWSNTSGGDNTASGYYALYYNTTGSSNTASGLRALYSNTTGEGNTAFGYQAGYSGTAITTGTYNTFVGYNASSDNSGRTNCIAIAGNGNLSLGGDNRVRIGNSSMASIGGQVGWTTISDERVKTDFRDDVVGLPFIMKLKPLTYTYDIDKEHELMWGKKDSANWKGKYDIEKIRFSGFLAQDVEEAAKEVGYDFSGVDKPQDEGALYGLRYAEFVVPLVKAVQELEKENRELRKENLGQGKEIDELRKEMDRLRKEIANIKGKNK